MTNWTSGKFIARQLKHFTPQNAVDQFRVHNLPLKLRKEAVKLEQNPEDAKLHTQILSRGQMRTGQEEGEKEHIQTGGGA